MLFFFFLPLVWLFDFPPTHTVFALPAVAFNALFLVSVLCLASYGDLTSFLAWLCYYSSFSPLSAFCSLLLHC